MTLHFAAANKIYALFNLEPLFLKSYLDVEYQMNELILTTEYYTIPLSKNKLLVSDNNIITQKRRFFRKTL